MRRANLFCHVPRRAGRAKAHSVNGEVMESLFANPLAPVVIVAAATLLLLFLWKILQLALKLAATLVFVALIGLAVFGLSELGFLGF